MRTATLPSSSTFDELAAPGPDEGLRPVAVAARVEAVLLGVEVGDLRCPPRRARPTSPERASSPASASRSRLHWRPSASVTCGHTVESALPGRRARAASGRKSASSSSMRPSRSSEDSPGRRSPCVQPMSARKMSGAVPCGRLAVTCGRARRRSRTTARSCVDGDAGMGRHPRVDERLDLARTRSRASCSRT